MANKFNNVRKKRRNEEKNNGKKTDGNVFENPILKPFVNAIEKPLGNVIGSITEKRKLASADYKKEKNKRNAVNLKNKCIDTKAASAEQPNSKEEPTVPTYEELWAETEKINDEMYELWKELLNKFNELYLPEGDNLDEFLELFNSERGIIQYMQLFIGWVKEYIFEYKQSSPEALQSNIYENYIKPLTELMDRAKEMATERAILYFEDEAALKEYLALKEEALPEGLSPEVLKKRKEKLKNDIRERASLAKALENKRRLLTSFKDKQGYNLLFLEPKARAYKKFNRLLNILNRKDIRDLCGCLEAVPAEDKKDEYAAKARELADKLEREAVPLARASDK